MTIERLTDRTETSDYYLVHNCSNGQLLGRIRNLTVAGMMLISEEPLDEGLVFQCRMGLIEPLDDVKEVLFDAEVRWCRENERAGWFEVGFRFTAIAEHHSAIIHKLLRSWLSAGSGRESEVRRRPPMRSKPS